MGVACSLFSSLLLFFLALHQPPLPTVPFTHFTFHHPIHLPQLMHRLLWPLSEVILTLMKEDDNVTELTKRT